MTIPLLGLGTFRLKDQVVIDSVSQALELGYRAIDTALIYGNEADVGHAIAASGVARNELFLTSKIWTENLGADKLIPSLKESLHKLGTDYLDLTLIHWPSPKGRRAGGRVHGRPARSEAPGPDPPDRRVQLHHRLAASGHRGGGRLNRSPPTRSSCTPTCRTARWWI